nr:hypothetical protein [Fusobacterium gastrosuis]
MSDLENRNEKGREEEIKARTRKIVEESLEKKIMEILKKNKEKIKEILFDNDDETREEIKKEEQKFFLNMLLESFPEIFESQKNIENIGDNMLEVKIKKVIEKIKGFFKLKIEKNNEEKQKINKLLLDEKENLAKLCNEIEDLKKEVEEKETKLKEKKKKVKELKLILMEG